MVIWKYPLAHLKYQSISIRKGAEPLSVIDQNGQIVLYALVDEDEVEHETLGVFIYATGERFLESDLDCLRPKKNFMGTIQQGDYYVWHVFICKEGQHEPTATDR